ncbi:hypothetical protein M422DRAFT_39978, partial [Sphaerobolus stellatus SS14]
MFLAKRNSVMAPHTPSPKMNLLNLVHSPGRTSVDLPSETPLHLDDQKTRTMSSSSYKPSEAPTNALGLDTTGTNCFLNEPTEYSMHTKWQDIPRPPPPAENKRIEAAQGLVSLKSPPVRLPSIGELLSPAHHRTDERKFLKLPPVEESNIPTPKLTVGTKHRCPYTVAGTPCPSTFVGKAELRRHVRHVHGAGELSLRQNLPISSRLGIATKSSGRSVRRNVLVCDGCGRFFESGRTDSLRRHKTRGACTKAQNTREQFE